MDRRPITLYAFAISPYVQKVAAILDFAADPIGATRKRIIAEAEVASRTSRV